MGAATGDKPFPGNSVTVTLSFSDLVIFQKEAKATPKEQTSLWFYDTGDTDNSAGLPLT